MSLVRTYEEELLAPAREALGRCTSGAAAERSAMAFDILEAAASRIGGFSLGDFRKCFAIEGALSSGDAYRAASELLAAFDHLSFPKPLALSALARQPLQKSEQRSTGAYYTDFRLASYVASLAAPVLRSGVRIIDPACGTGILLVAASVAASSHAKVDIRSWLAESVWGADLSSEALRGARLALASMTDDLHAIKCLNAHLLKQDSLLAGTTPYERFRVGGFDVVLGNPPWEKVKLTRHEFIRARGGERHYGADYLPGAVDEHVYDTERKELADYAHMLSQRYGLLGDGEPDLYKAFIELFARLVVPGGAACILVPAGLIRSQGTEALRQFLFQSADNLAFTVMENRARFFSIDTRFKFLALSFSMPENGKRRKEFSVHHARGTDSGIELFGSATLGRRTLARARADLTVPEVRDMREWRIFTRAMRQGVRWDSPSSEWGPRIVREVDMTRDRQHFLRDQAHGAIPLIEGRMVHQHRFGAKRYLSGTGRRARWETVPIGAHSATPQFWFPQQELSPSVLERTRLVRAGFCDITGQTNERSMLAALIPPGVVCGNKVPTLTFANDGAVDRLFLWLAIVNSLPFDWLLRRVVTTTVNYFVLLSVPLPRISPSSARGRHLVTAAKELHQADSGHCLHVDPWWVGELRAFIDVAVSRAYGLRYDELQAVLRDFPLLDRGQRPLEGEPRCTVTRDLLLLRAAQCYKEPTRELEARVAAARRIGAIPYVPAEFADAEEETAEINVGASGSYKGRLQADSRGGLAQVSGAVQ